MTSFLATPTPASAQTGALRTHNPAVLVDATTCTFRSPVDVDDGKLNVEVVYSSFGTEILDLDDKEGFVFVDGDPRSFRLADNLCASNYKTGKILGVYAAPGCPAKRASQPICTSELQAIQGGSRAVAVEREDLCSVAQPLTPSDSAVYLVMDNSRSMAAHFGDTSLSNVLDQTLASPTAQQSRLALSFMPAAASDCPADSSTFASPSFGFESAADMRDPIADALGDADNVLADDPELYTDGAMLGAYEALRDESASRKALVLIGNRDFGSHCARDDGEDLEQAATRAADALDQDKIETYVALVDGADATAETRAGAIATSGGTQGPVTLVDAMVQLNSCVYDAPNSALDITHLSFMDPITKERVVIDEDPACTDGFAVDSGQIRVCGNACASIRSAMLNSAAPVPVVPQSACE